MLSNVIYLMLSFGVGAVLSKFEIHDTDTIIAGAELAEKIIKEFSDKHGYMVVEYAYRDMVDVKDPQLGDSPKEYAIRSTSHLIRGGAWHDRWYEIKAIANEARRREDER